MTETTEPCCDGGPPGHTEQQHHDASPCYDQACAFDHPYGGPFPHPCDAPGVVLDVAMVFPHPEGQAMWWESYNRRGATGRAELLADLRRRIERDQ